MKKLFFTLLIIHCSLHFANAQWIIVNDSTRNPVTVFVDNGYYLYAAVTGDGLYKTSNNGMSWNLSSDLIKKRIINGIAVKDSIVFLATDTGLYKSINFGNNWTLLNLGINCIYACSVIIANNYLFVGTYLGIKRSTDLGNSFELVNNEINWLHQSVKNFAYTNSTLYTGIDSSYHIRIYKSTNYGNNWILISQGIPEWNLPYYLYACENLILCGTESGVYKSLNGGISWSKITDIPTGIFGFASVGMKNIFISSWNHGFYVSNDSGKTWTQKNEGLLSLCTTALYKYTDNLYLGTNWNSVIYRRSLNEVIGIKNISSEIPINCKLFQNYPNPFNSNTIIRFQNNDSKFITLKIFDILGKEIATFVNEKLKAGVYEIQLNGESLSSGIFYYSIYADNKVIDTKKFIIIK
jgi:hypothetical protein